MQNVQNMKKLGLWALQWVLAGALLALLGACGAQQEPAAKLPQPVVNQTTSTFTVSTKGLTVTFDASAFSGTQSGTQTTSAARFQWNFGDGTPVQSTTSVTITHVYAASGTYVVNLVVLDAQGVAGKVVSQNVTVAALPVNQAPRAQFASAVNVLSVGLDASLSSDPDGTITTYAWNFGDPNSRTNTANGITATHTYGTAGSYTVSLVVTDNTGLTATSQQSVNISGPPNINPVANFGFSADALLVNFNAVDSIDPDGKITTYSWDFGDASGTAIASFTATHAYKFAGNYTVTLTVTDNRGGTSNTQRAIQLFAPAAIATGVLNDTGVTDLQCYQLGSDTLVACNSVAAIGTFTIPGTVSTTFAPQDGMVGRDAEPGSNIAADGNLGFSFTKIGASGQVLPTDAPQWSCIRDNVTGLMWENKTFSNNSTGLRDSGRLFTNYDNANAKQLANGGVPTLAQIATVTNSIGFRNAVNAEGLCGATDWRIPESGEMLGIFNHNNQQAQGLDSAWFSSYLGATANYIFITASASAGLLDAEYVAYSAGGNLALSRSTPSNLHLVRGAPNAVVRLRFVLQAQTREVFDLTTGLIWRACTEGMNLDVNNCFGTPTLFTHEAALIRATQVGNGWRLPNAKELESIVDRGFINPANGVAAIDSTAFPSTPPRGFWSSTPSAPYAAQPTGQVNIVEFDSGRNAIASRIPSNAFYVRLVRDNNIP
jgi:PKD repeat protein